MILTKTCVIFITRTSFVSSTPAHQKLLAKACTMGGSVHGQHTLNTQKKRKKKNQELGFLINL